MRPGHQKYGAPKSGQGLGAQIKTKSECEYSRLGSCCYCGYLRLKGVRAICATCFSFDRVAREVELRKMLSYVGFVS
jgi:hypothetical protein